MKRTKPLSRKELCRLQAERRANAIVSSANELMLLHDHARALGMDKLAEKLNTEAFVLKATAEEVRASWY